MGDEVLFVGSMGILTLTNRHLGSHLLWVRNFAGTNLPAVNPNSPCQHVGDDCDPSKLSFVNSDAFTDF
jgi:hypothetical protein